MQSPPDGQPLLRVSSVNHFFGADETRTQVLFDNNLGVLPGELVIISGPSGCGKTTLLTLVGGLRTLQDGDIEIWDTASASYQSLVGMGEDQRVRVRQMIGFIFQRHNLFESLTALQNVRMAQQLKPMGDDADAKAKHLLGQLGLGERIAYKPQQLSGGQRQRVAVARALINRPKLILADEPTAALDERSGEAVIQLLRQLAREEGCTSLIVTHDSRIMNTADRIVDVERGRIISNIVVSERLFLYNTLRECVLFAALLPQEQFRIADQISIGVDPDVSVPPDVVQRCPWFKTYSPGSVIFRQGERGDEFFVIRRGKVRATMEDDASGSREIGQLGKGDFFGDRSLLRDEPRPVTVRALETVETYTVGRELFQQARKESIPFINRILKVYDIRESIQSDSSPPPEPPAEATPRAT
jgi:putative ABC transport system ATP-binding protein